VRAVFLDRDGVLNAAVVRDGRPYPPSSAAVMEIVPAAPACLRKLREAGYLLIVVTNQPDLARGKQTREAMEEIHAALRAAMPIDAIFVCPHDGAEACACRKPKPGLLLQAAAEWNVTLAESFMVGDRWRDVDAGAQAGCRTVFIDYGYQERGPEAAPSITVQRLEQGVDWILNQSPGIADRA
jgi:D-glycero-D-manno-heptose 1,7-bisphosphate phosphatase